MEAYTVSGSRIGLPGIVPFATIPRSWTVLQCKQTTGWFKVIKDVQQGEMPKMGINFEMMETEDGKPWLPTVILFSRASVGKEAIRGVNLDRVSDYNADFLIAINTVTDCQADMDPTQKEAEENFRRWSRCRPEKRKREGSCATQASSESKADSGEEDIDVTGAETCPKPLLSDPFQFRSDRLFGKGARLINRIRASCRKTNNGSRSTRPERLCGKGS